MIIRSGFNVYTAEIEAVLNSHKDVVQSAVVGRVIEGNEEVVAFVQLMQATTTNSDEFMAYVAPQLTSYKRPCEIMVLPPRPPTSPATILNHKLPAAPRT